MQIKLHIWSCLSVCPKLFVQIFKQGSLKRLFDSVILFGKSLAGKGGRGHNWQQIFSGLFTAWAWGISVAVAIIKGDKDRVKAFSSLYICSFTGLSLIKCWVHNWMSTTPHYDLFIPNAMNDKC